MEPWYKVVLPRQELREDHSLDPSEFAVHLEQDAAGTAPADYVKPEKFFARNYFSNALVDHCGMVLRRLNGEAGPNPAAVAWSSRRPGVMKGAGSELGLGMFVQEGVGDVNDAENGLLHGESRRNAQPFQHHGNYRHFPGGQVRTRFDQGPNGGGEEKDGYN
jgi:hypothetical protein